MRLFPKRKLRQLTWVFFLACVSLLCTRTLTAQARAWRAASPAELEAVLPARAPVGAERIETEMRTATGIANDHQEIIAAVVLITAGYAADGKYSHYLLLQAPLVVAGQSLAPGAYVVGWSRQEGDLAVHIFEAASGMEKATVLAKPIPNLHGIESFRIWPPGEHAYIQIGRYMLPYNLR